LQLKTYPDHYEKRVCVFSYGPPEGKVNGVGSKAVTENATVKYHLAIDSYTIRFTCDKNRGEMN